MIERRTELIGQKTDYLFLVRAGNQYHIFTKEQFADGPKALSELSFELKVENVKKIKNLAGQKLEVDDLAFQLKKTVEILETLAASASELDVSSKEYNTAMENISNFVQTNIIDIAKEKIEELDLLLQAIN